MITVRYDKNGRLIIEREQEQGAKQPKQPSTAKQLAQTLGMVAASTGAQYAGQKAAEYIGPVAKATAKKVYDWANTPMYNKTASLPAAEAMKAPGMATSSKIAGTQALNPATGMPVEPMSVADIAGAGGTSPMYSSVDAINSSSGMAPNMTSIETGQPIAPPPVEAGLTPWQAAQGAAGVAAGAYGLHQGYRSGVMDHQNRNLRSGVSNTAAAGALGAGLNTLGVALGPWGWGALAAAALYNTFARAGKHKSRMERDRNRKALQALGLVDKDWKIYNPDGTSFEVGQERQSSEKYGTHETGRALYPYEIDTSKQSKLLGDTADRARALATIMFDSKKERDAWTGYLTRTALQAKDNQGVNQAIQSLWGRYSQHILPDQMRNRINEAAKYGEISAEDAARYNDYVSRYNTQQTITPDQVKDVASLGQFLRQMRMQESVSGRGL